MTRNRFLRRLLTEPFVHFLVGGSLLFVLYAATNRQRSLDPSVNPMQIVVTNDGLLDFYRFRSKSIAPASFEQQYRDLGNRELKRLISEYVRVEALYREAQAMGFGEHDFGVRQRLVTQLEFVNQSMVAAGIKLADDDLKAHLAANEHRYREPAKITFTHVYFKADDHSDESARSSAQATLKQLQRGADGNPVPFHKAPNFGDRFLYQQNYVKRTAAEIKSHFGRSLQQELFALEPNESNWLGPLRSTYGYHLVLVTQRIDPVMPSFEILKPRLQADAYQAKLDEALRQTETELVDAYTVQLDPALTDRLDQAPSGIKADD